MSSLGKKVAASLAAVALALSASVAMAGSASAAMDPRCGVYPTAPTKATSISFSSTATCGTNALVKSAQSRLEGPKTVNSALKTSSGTTTLVAPGTTSCTASGSYRTYGNGTDIYTSISEAWSGYRTISC